MQLAPIATPLVAPAGARGPRFSGGIDFTGDGGKFTSFSAHSKGGAYGEATGYETLPQAIEALTMLTVGVSQPAAGIFERNGRFYGRQLDNTVTFLSGKTWTGMWRLEQHPGDADLLQGKLAETTKRADALRAIVDGAQRIDVSHLPVAKRTQ